MRFSGLTKGAGVLTAVLAANQYCCGAEASLIPGAWHVLDARHHARYSTSTPHYHSSDLSSASSPESTSADHKTATATSSSSSSSSSNGPAKQQQSAAEQHVKRQWPKSLREGTHFAVLMGNGSASKLASITAAMQHVDVVLLGEYHDDPVAHALQLELLKRAAKQLGHTLLTPPPAAAAAAAAGGGSAPAGLTDSTSQQPAGPASLHEQQKEQQLQQDAPQHKEAAAGIQLQQQQQGLPQPPQQQQLPPRHLVLSLEMFERDVQPVLDEYLSGHIQLQDMLRDSRPWPNYKTDYQPLVDLCKQLAAAAATQQQQRLPVRVVAANAPRRYVSLAGRSSRQALLQLPAAAKSFLPPLPYSQPSQAYVDKVQSSMRQAAEEMRRLRQQGMEKVEQQSAAVDAQQQQQAGSSKLGQQPNAADDVQGRVGKAETTAAAAAATAAAAAAAAATTATAPSSLQPMERAPAAAAGSSEGDGGACPYIGFNVSTNFLDAQSLWDATMAYAIAEQLQQQPGQGVGSTIQHTSSLANGSAAVAAAANHESACSAASRQPLVLHVCGKFHCESKLGIPEHLAVYAPGARVLCVVFVPSDSMSMTGQEFQAAGLQGAADFVVLTDGSLPRSFASQHPV